MPDRFGVGGIVGVGNSITLTFTNSNLANTTQLVSVSDLSGHSTDLEFTLDSSGVGTLSWTVPNWDLFVLSHSTSQDHAVVIP